MSSNIGSYSLKSWVLVLEIPHRDYLRGFDTGQAQNSLAKTTGELSY
jgi:hypothetical protein